MKYKKCSRCELNYINEDSIYCDICLRELKGENLDKEYCCVCGSELKDYEIEVCHNCNNGESEYYD